LADGFDFVFSCFGAAAGMLSSFQALIPTHFTTIWPAAFSVIDAKRLVSRTRLVMGLLLIVAIPIFISLANKAVHENAEAIQQVFGR
jgi:hypothetical protein